MMALLSAGVILCSMHTKLAHQSKYAAIVSAWVDILLCCPAMLCKGYTCTMSHAVQHTQRSLPLFGLDIGIAYKISTMSYCHVINANTALCPVILCVVACGALIHDATWSQFVTVHIAEAKCAYQACILHTFYTQFLQPTTRSSPTAISAL